MGKTFKEDWLKNFLLAVSCLGVSACKNIMSMTKMFSSSIFPYVRFAFPILTTDRWQPSYVTQYQPVSSVLGRTTVKFCRSLAYIWDVFLLFSWSAAVEVGHSIQPNWSDQLWCCKRGILGIHHHWLNLVKGKLILLSTFWRDMQEAGQTEKLKCQPTCYRSAAKPEQGMYISLFIMYSSVWTGNCTFKKMSVRKSKMHFILCFVNDLLDLD